MKEVTIKLSREEAMACAVALATFRNPYNKKKSCGWCQDALAKVDKAIGFRQ